MRFNIVQTLHIFEYLLQKPDETVYYSILRCKRMIEAASTF